MNDTNAQNQKKVWELIKDIKIPLLVTHTDNGLHARPMGALNRDFDGKLWFFTKSDAPKIDEIKRNPNVLLSYSNPSKQEYVSITGTAAVLDDRNKIKELWSEMARIWFPKGSEDPSIRLIRIDVESAEYWDSPASAVVLLYGYAKAQITGETPKIGENKKVSFS
jgi:general stress protein 26